MVTCNLAESGSTRQPGDFEEGLRAAAAIGDDRLQRMKSGHVAPESFTHGTSQERTAWLRRGLTTGDPARCDTPSAERSTSPQSRRRSRRATAARKPPRRTSIPPESVGTFAEGPPGGVGVGVGTPEGVTVGVGGAPPALKHAENSEVLPGSSVAVAVKIV